MKNLDLAQLTALMENVKEAAGNIQLECMQEAANMDKVRELVNVGLMGLIGLLRPMGLLGKSGRKSRRIKKDKSGKRNINK